jgi:catalase
VQADAPSPSLSTLLATPSARIRLVAVALVSGSVVAAFAYAGGWLTPKALTPSRMVDTFEHNGGAHPGFRRNHAKGIGVSGFFESNGAGATLSRASIFAKGRVAVLGRFALAGAQPYAADAPHSVRSMALLFTLPDGEEWRTGMNAIPVFAVRTPQAFHDLLEASAPDPSTGKSDPGKMGTFLAEYPESARAMQAIRNAPVSSGFGNSTYNSLDAFRFVSANGASVAVRWAMESGQAFAPITPTAAAHPEDTQKNALFDALIAELKDHPLVWHLVVTKGEAGDPTSDATLAWPPDRTRVDVGTLTLDHVESEETSPARDINFDPLILPDGIAPSDDPLLSARSAAYAQSFTRREGETKTPSAVPAAEVSK